MKLLVQRVQTANKGPSLSCRLGSRLLLLAVFISTAAAAPVTPRVELEETVYSYTPANNGAGPMWCSGSTTLVRAGNHLFASGLETIPESKPLNNCRWMLFERKDSGWELVRRDMEGRTREPSPLAAFGDRVFLSANPTLSKAESGGGPSRPEILEFSAEAPKIGSKTIVPLWDGTPKFTEHSYRSFAADSKNRELILFQNIDYTHAEWSLLAGGSTAAKGKLLWPPISTTNGKPLRVCYPNVALRDRAVYFCGVSDIVEPKQEWREFKRQLTGQEWDYDFRRLFFTWTPDVSKAPFSNWVEVASRDATCGWISPGDLSVDSQGTVHLLWTERALDERLRARFFPTAKQQHSLQYAQVRNGRVAVTKALVVADEGKPGIVPSAGRFHILPDGRLIVVYHASGTEADGKTVSENRLIELDRSGEPVSTTRLPLSAPFTSYFTATPRAGSAPSKVLEMLGTVSGKPNTISFARIRLADD